MAASRPARVIFLTGAPSLDEVRAGELLSELDPAVQRFVSGRQPDAISDPTLSNAWPKWRAFHSVQDKEDYQIERHAPAFLEGQYSFMSVDTQQDQHNVNYDFLQHSLAVFTKEAEETSVSETFNESTFLDNTILSDLTEEDSHMSPLRQPLQLKFPTMVTELKRLPSAAVVENSYPQTITVDLIVGVISVAPVRSVEVKKTKFPRPMQLIEAVVGDDTSTGFSITIWLPVTQYTHDELGRTASALRSRQIVLMRNIALHVWQGRVYGQSLRRKMTTFGTSIVRLDGHTETLPPLLAKKQERVESWVLQFLLSTSDTPAKTSRSMKKRPTHQAFAEQSELPPDTLPQDTFG